MKEDKIDVGNESGKLKMVVTVEALKKNEKGVKAKSP